MPPRRTGQRRLSPLKIFRGISQVAASAVGPATTGTFYKMKFSVQTTAPGTTQLDMKFWKAIDPEPGGWTLSYTDTNVALQGVSGRVGVCGKTAVSGGRYWRYDNYSADGFVPEPATLALVGLGGLTLPLRKRRA